MRGPLRFVAVVLLSLSLGLHWAALQSVAWTSMLLSRAQNGNIAEALRTTFDGKHPCPICLVVREGRAAERQAPTSPTPSGSYAPKLDLTPGSSPFQLISDASVPPPPTIASLPFRSRSDRPPLRPPRFA